MAGCGCRMAINRATIEAVDADFPATCRKGPCPPFACLKPPSGARCVKGRCEAM
jgi:hypothetical protein